MVGASRSSRLSFVFIANFIVTLSVVALSNFNVQTAYASTLTLNVSDSIVATVLPKGTGDTTAVSDTTVTNISVVTDDTAGYTLSLSSSSDSAPALVNGSNTINSISSETAALSNFTTDTWGYKPTKKNGTSWDNLTVSHDATSYTAGYFLPAPTTTADVLDITTEANTTANEYNIALGTKVDANTAIGSYSGTFTVMAVANEVPLYMQDVSDWKDEIPNAGDSVQAIDRRDNKRYWVTRLADGNIWMTQNLDLDLDSTKTYTSSDTDISADWTPSLSTYTTGTTTWNSSATTPESSDPGDMCYDGNTQETCTSANKSYHVGNYYNWTAAIATNDSSSYTSDGDMATQSICPSGWTLPLGGNNTGSKSFYYLLDQYGLTDSATSGSYSIWGNPLNFVLGYSWAGSQNLSLEATNYGSYWSSTSKASSTAYGLYFDYMDNVDSQSTDSRGYGLSVRCVATPNITVTYDAQGGSFSGESTNEMVYSSPQNITYPAVTATGSTTNSTTASGTKKTSITDGTQYKNNSNYYQDLTLDTQADGPYTLTVYYDTEVIEDYICVFDGTDYTPGSSDSCTTAHGALTPISNIYGTRNGYISGNQISGMNEDKTNYTVIATFSVSSKTARVYFHSGSDDVSYGFWAEFTGGGDTVTTQDKISGAYAMPTKDGLTFAGWSTTEGGTTADWVYNEDTIYDDDLTLYAVWIDEIYMQDVSIWESTLIPNVGDSTYAIDERDGESYQVKRLADGNVWMLDNLRLGSTSTISLTPSDTNITSNYTLPASGTTNFSNVSGGVSTTKGYTNAAINVDSKNTTLSSYSTRKIGVYYNYCAASAGTICTSSNSSDASYDICPKDWRMPTKTEYLTLHTAYVDNPNDNYKKSLFMDTLVLIHSGRFYSGSAYNQGSEGYFWSSTRNDNTSMYYLDLDYASNSTMKTEDRYYGNSMRCVAQ